MKHWLNSIRAYITKHGFWSTSQESGIPVESLMNFCDGKDPQEQSVQKLIDNLGFCIEELPDIEYVLNMLPEQDSFIGVADTYGEINKRYLNFDGDEVEQLFRKIVIKTHKKDLKKKRASEDLLTTFELNYIANDLIDKALASGGLATLKIWAA